MTDTNIERNVEFIQRRELAVVKQALTAMRDCLALKREIGLPVLHETREAILELESQILSLKEELLRSLSQHPDQLMLPDMPVWPTPGGSYGAHPERTPPGESPLRSVQCHSALDTGVCANGAGSTSSAATRSGTTAISPASFTTGAAHPISPSPWSRRPSSPPAPACRGCAPSATWSTQGRAGESPGYLAALTTWPEMDH